MFAMAVMGNTPGSPAAPDHFALRTAMRLSEPAMNSGTPTSA
jgi:hypothetical protein